MLQAAFARYVAPVPARGPRGSLPPVFRAGVISITPMHGDMTAGPLGLAQAKVVRRRLEP
jgi:hypothetical protein